MFQGLRSGTLVYILDKSDKPTLKIGQVQSVSNPQPKYGYNTFGQPLEMFVDVVAKVGDEEVTLKELPSNQSVTNCNKMVVSDNREAMCAEIDGMIRASKMILDSVEYHKQVIVSCDAMMKELNPQFAKEKEQEEKIKSLEGRMTSIDKNMDDIKRMLTKALDTGTKSK